MADAATLERAPPPLLAAPAPLRVDTGAMGEDRAQLGVSAVSPSPAAAAPPPAGTATSASPGTTTPAGADVTPRAPAMSPPAAAAMSRSGMGVSARGIRQKVVDEIKSVRRKAERSQALPTPLQLSMSAGPGALGAAGVPPPLSLNDDAVGPVTSPPTASQPSPSGEADANASVGAGSGGKTKGCSICERAFTVFRAKHTCKICAQKICDDCSRNRMKLNRRLERKKGSRLCDPCARNYIQTPTGTPMLSPAPSPPLSPRQRDLQAAFPLGGSGIGGFQLPRRHSVPAKTLNEFLHERKFADTSSAALATLNESGSTAAAAAAGEKQRRPSQSRRKARRNSVSAYRPQSHLHQRHWISLAVVGVLLLVRVFLTRSIDGSAPAGHSSATANSVSGAPTQSLMLRGVDSLLSLRILGTYIIGLIVFDEVRRSQRQKRAVAQKPPIPGRVRRVSSTGDMLHMSRSSSVGSVHDRAESGFIQQQQQQQRLSSPSPRTSQEEDELLEVDTGDLVDTQKDDDRVLDNLVNILDEGVKLRASDGGLELGRYMRTCDIICAFIQVFGRATSFAGSTVSAYLTSVENNLAAWPSPPPPAMEWKEMSVKFVIEREVELKIANVGGKKKPSCSRCLLRLLWFLEFVEACIEHGLLASQDENCAPGAGKAYEETIGKRHPWLIRKGVMSALSAIPSRSSILASLNIADGSSEEQLAPLRHAQRLLKAVADELNTVFTEHDLMDLK
jgi:hypothetical protein